MYSYLGIFSIAVGFLSSAAPSEEVSNVETFGGDTISNVQDVLPTDMISTAVSKISYQRRKTLRRSDAVCHPYCDFDTNQGSVDVIDVVHNNKKEKITVIVNLLSDDMLTAQRQDNSLSLQGNVNERDGILLDTDSKTSECQRTENTNRSKVTITEEVGKDLNQSNPHIKNKNSREFLQINGISSLKNKGDTK